MATYTTPRFPDFTATDEERQGKAFSRPAPRVLKHGLSDEQLDFFWQNGYVSLPGVFSPQEAGELQEAADRIYRSPRANVQNIRYDYTDKDGQKVLWKIDPFFDLDEILRRCVFDRRILDPLASIYEGREPRLFKDKLIYKPPHTHGNALHQDYNWWQGYPTSLISVTVCVDGADEANGCTVVYPRDPRKGFVGQPGSFDNGEAIQNDPSVSPEKAVKNIAQPGDVLLFHCFTPHEAGPNTTDRFRRQMFLTYNDSGDGEYYFSHGDHYQQYYLASRKDPENYYFL